MGENALLLAVDFRIHIDALCSVVHPTVQKFTEVKQGLGAAAGNNPAWRQIVSSISQFAEAHGGKVQHVGVAGGFLISSFPLYKSVTLAGEIEGFFDEIERLKGQYKVHNAETALLIQLYERVPKMMMQRKFFEEN